MDYYREKQVANQKKLRSILKELPSFALEFFVGISSKTSILTRINYAYDLRIFFDYLENEVLLKPAQSMAIADMEGLNVTDIEMFLHYVSAYEFRESRNSNRERGKARKLATVRSFFKYYFNKESLAANTAAKVSLPKLHDKEIIRLDTDEVTKLLNQAETGSGLTKKQKDFHAKTHKRDLAILTLFLGTGIRISECVGLDVDDIDFRNSAFKITRKGGNRTILYFSEEVAIALHEYIVERNQNSDIESSEHALFLSGQNKRISVRAVENLVKKYSGIISPLKRITPHKLRSTYGTALYRETGDIYVVAEVLGHKDINTTKKHYAAMSEDIRRDAASKVKLRDEGP